MSTINKLTTLDEIDLWLDPRKFRWTFWLSILVVMVPWINWMLDSPNFEAAITTAYILYILLLFVLTLNRFKDQEGKFSLGPAINRYFGILSENWGELSANITDKGIREYLIGKKLIYLGIFWWAFTEFAQFIRFILMDTFSASGELWMKIIRGGSSFSIFIILGAILILYKAAKKNKDVQDILRGDWKYLLFKTNNKGVVDRNYKVSFEDNFVFDLTKRSNEDLKNMKKALGRDLLEIMEVISSWQAGSGNYVDESDYEKSLVKAIKRKYPHYDVLTQHRVKSEGGRVYVFDILINQSIVLELKKDTSSRSINDGKGQVFRYSEVWEDKGPVILLLCEGNLSKQEVDLNNFFKKNKYLSSFAVLARKV